MFVHYKLIRIKIWAGFRGYAQFDCCYITITTDACKVLTPVQEKMLFCANKENGTPFSLLLDIIGLIVCLRLDGTGVKVVLLREPSAYSFGGT